VQAFEDVKTQAGTFKAYRIFRNWALERFEGRGSTSWTQVVWFAPEVKQIVKFTSTQQGGPPEFELASYNLK